MKEEIKKYDPNELDFQAWRPHMCQFFREAVLRISRNELAERIKVAGGTIAVWENPKTKIVPNRVNLENLCKAFDCEPFELYSDFNPEHTREFLEDTFKTWSFVLQRSIRSDAVSEKKFALQLTQLFMDYDERRRAWEAGDPKDATSKQVESDLDKVMFGPQNEESKEVEGDSDIEEGSEEDIEEEGKKIHALTPPVE